MNVGKKFETQFVKYAPDYALIHRMPDSAQSFGRSQNLRFSRKNPFDFQIWDSRNGTLYALELKSKSGKSISFERTKSDKGDIHYHQIEGLRLWGSYNGIVAGLIVEFRDLEKTIFIDIHDFDTLLSAIDKKSFNLDDLDKNDISYMVIPQEKLRENYKYDLDYFLNNNKGVRNESKESLKS